MTNKKNNNKQSNVKHKVAQKHYSDIREGCSNIDGEFVVNHNKKQPTITQSCATPPRPTRGSNKNS